MWKKYWTITVTGFREATVYRLNAFMNIVTSAIFLLLMYALWSSIAAAGELQGGLVQVMTYLVVGQIVSNTVFVNAEEFLGERIREGTIVNELKRPIGLRTQTYFRLLGRTVFNFIVKAVPIGVIGAIFLDLQLPTLQYAVLFLVSLFFSFHLVFLFSYTVSMLVFWTKVSWSLRMMRSLVQRLFSGALFPLYLLPASLVPVFDALPFQSMVDGPISIFLMQVQGQAVVTVFGKQLLWLVILFVLSEVMWRRAKAKLTVQGG